MAAFRDEWPCLIIVPSSLRGDLPLIPLLCMLARLSWPPDGNLDSSPSHPIQEKCCGPLGDAITALMQSISVAPIGEPAAETKAPVGLAPYLATATQFAIHFDSTFSLEFRSSARILRENVDAQSNG